MYDVMSDMVLLVSYFVTRGSPALLDQQSRPYLFVALYCCKFSNPVMHDPFSLQTIKRPKPLKVI